MEEEMQPESGHVVGWGGWQGARKPPGVGWGLIAVRMVVDNAMASSLWAPPAEWTHPAWWWAVTEPSFLCTVPPVVADGTAGAHGPPLHGALCTTWPQHEPPQ